MTIEIRIGSLAIATVDVVDVDPNQIITLGGQEFVVDADRRIARWREAT